MIKLKLLPLVSGSTCLLLSLSPIWHQHVHKLSKVLQSSSASSETTAPSAHRLQLGLSPCCFINNHISICFSSFINILKSPALMAPSYLLFQGYPFLSTYYHFNRIFMRREIRQTTVVTLPSCFGISLCQNSDYTPTGHKLMNSIRPVNIH